MTTITIKKESKNKVLVFNSIEKLKDTIVGFTKGSASKDGHSYVSIKEKSGEVKEYMFVAVSFDQNDDALPYLRRLKIIEKTYFGD